MLSKKKKDNIIKKFKTHENDTGSPEVQIAILTEEVRELAKHLKSHKQDHSSRRGLLRKVSLRRRLLKYLERENKESYLKLIKALKLKTRVLAEVEKNLLAEEEAEESEEEGEARSV